MSSLNLGKQLGEFDDSHMADPMFQWARMYMRQVMTLLQFQTAIWEGNWYLYLASLQHLCKYFFAYSRLYYDWNIIEFIAWMDSLIQNNGWVSPIRSLQWIPAIVLHSRDGKPEQINKRPRRDIWHNNISSIEVLSFCTGAGMTCWGVRTTCSFYQ